MKEIAIFKCEKCGKHFMTKADCTAHEETCNTVYVFEITLSWDVSKDKWDWNIIEFHDTPNPPSFIDLGSSFTGKFNADMGQGKALELMKQHVHDALKVRMDRIDHDVPTIKENKDEK